MVGSMGTGKTLSSVRYAYLWYKKGYTIYSNIKLNFPSVRIGLQELIDFANAETYLDKSIVLLDEAHVFLDSRNSQSKRNKMISYFIVLTRKMGCHLIYTTQKFHQIDKRLRDNSDVVVNCTTKTYRGEKYTHNLILIIKSFNIVKKHDVFKSSLYYNLYNTRELVRIE